ncbi:trp operon leader peptide [Streptomyces sp. NPDC048442]
MCAPDRRGWAQLLSSRGRPRAWGRVRHMFATTQTTQVQNWWWTAHPAAH